jgi:quercetin dioxygenase-like cupin family protein
MSTRDGSLLHADVLASGDGAAEPVAPSGELRASVLRSISQPGVLTGYAGRFARMFDLTEERALELLAQAQVPAVAQRAGAWEATPLAGVRLQHFAGGARVARADCGFVSFAPGVRFPEHLHEGDEWTLVLAGEAEEESSGARWLPGDLVHRAAGSRHAFRVTSAEPLVFAVILEAPIRVVELAGAR